MKYLMYILLLVSPIYSMKSPKTSRITIVVDHVDERPTINDNSLKAMISYYLTRESKIIEEKIYSDLAETVLLSYSVTGDIQYTVDGLITDVIENAFIKADQDFDDYKQKQEVIKYRFRYAIVAISVLGVITTAWGILATYFSSRC
jgi:hypothetical protein